MQQTKTSPISFQRKDVNGDTLTPISVFQRITGKRKFLLESSHKHSEKGRFSIIGLDPFKEIVGRGKTTTVTYYQENSQETTEEKALDVIQKQLPNARLPLPFSFYGGAVGYIGYDSIRQYENIGRENEDPVDMPDVHLMIYQDVIVFDHVKQTVSIMSMDLTGKRTEEELERRVDTLQKEIYTDQEDQDQGISSVAFEPTIDKDTFLEMVETAKQHIIRGDIFQVVVSQRMKAAFHSDPFAFYRSLRRTNPSPYMFYLDFEDYTVLGASPESLIKTKDNQVVTNPIAGTRPRGKITEEDDRLAEELLADEKELAEHKMLVDLSRNDLGKVCEIGSITVPTYMTIEKYQHVMHIVSEVQGTVRSDYTSMDALISTLPAGTVSGAPKIRAMQIINDLEREKRGAYAGAVGYLNINGDLDFALAIRTLVIKDELAYVQAGAGVVYDSDPEKEYQETLNKAKALLEVNANDSLNR